jgi:flagellin-like hook-associated protein FlgL
VEDADLAKELTKISAGLIQEQAQIAVQAQANASRGFALQLLK